jgi:predicted Ser/Thr protein kinase
VSGEATDGDLGQRAVELGFITADELNQLLLKLSETRPPGKEAIVSALLTKGLLTESQIAALFTQQLRPGTSIGRYQLLRELGRGGMGVVFEAEDRDLHRRVALKFLRVPSPGGAGETSREEEERFVQEARLTANLPKHPNLVSVYDAGMLEGRRFIAMEFVEGLDYSEWRRKCSAPLRDQVEVLRDTALAVDHAHRHGVIHRDLKPANVLVDSQGHPHVTDFGIAKRLRPGTHAALTVTGVAMGTPAYMSPEQAEGRKDLDQRTDVWSLGVMLYEILAGGVPFLGASPVEVLLKTVKDPVVPPSSRTGGASPAPPRALERICLRALEKDPKDRYASVDLFALDLSRWLRGESVRVRLPGAARRQMLRGAIVLLGILAVGIGGMLVRERKPSPAAEEAVRKARAVTAEHPEDVDRQIDAWEKARTLAAGTGLEGVVRKEEEVARARRKDLFSRDLAQLDRDVQLNRDEQNYGGAHELLEQALQRHPTPEWTREVERRRSEFGRAVQEEFAQIKEGALSAKRRGDRGTFRALFEGVVRQWNWPSYESELRSALDQVPLGKISIELGPPPGVVELEPLRGHGNGVQSVAISPDGKSIVSSSYDKTLRLWDLASRTERATLFKGEECNGAVFSPDGRSIAAGFWDGSVRVWDTEGFRSRTIMGHRLQIRGLAFSSDSRLLASASTDRTVRIRDLQGTSEVRVLEGHPKGAFSVAFSRDDRFVAAGSGSGEIRLWPLNPGGSPRILAPIAIGRASTLTFDPAGHTVTAGLLDGRILRWELASGQTSVWSGHQCEVWSLAYTPDGRWLLSGSSDGTLRVWETSSGKCLGGYPDEGGFFGVAVSKDGKFLAACSGSRLVRLWDLSGLGSK